MNSTLKLASALLLLCLATVQATSAAAARQHSTDPMDWIIQHVCVDAADAPIPVDPYPECPANSTERRLKPGDLLPYLRHDQPGADGDHPHGYQRHDAYPIYDLKSGGVSSANDFDFDYFEPYGTMHPRDGDGYDLYLVADGWVTASDTRDGGGYSQVFFGASCKPFGGWVFFPTRFLQSLNSQPRGQAVVPIRGSYWEQNGEPWPGSCEPGQAYSNDTLTTWEFVKSYPFGGYNGSPTKLIDTIISTHGLPAQRGSRPHFHLERFYFTDLYGITRWEVWVQDSENAKPKVGCAGATTMTYEGIGFTRAACRDWSVTEVNDPPKPRFPWPYPASNLLKNYHFDAQNIRPWRTNTGGHGNVITVSFSNSSGVDDTRHSKNNVGVRYARVSCEASCDSDLAISQDVPVSRLPKSGKYDYGFSGVVEGSSAGRMKVTLSQVDAAEHVLSSTNFIVDVPVARPAPAAHPEWSDSIYHSVFMFLTTSPVISIQPGAAVLRFSLSPMMPATYAIMDTWLMPR